MGHVLELTDEQYETLREAAALRGESPQDLLDQIVKALTEAQRPVYLTEDEMFSALDAYAEAAEAEHGADSDADE